MAASAVLGVYIIHRLKMVMELLRNADYKPTKTMMQQDSNIKKFCELKKREYRDGVKSDETR